MVKDLNKYVRALLDELSSQGVSVMSGSDALDFVKMRYGNDPELADSLILIASQIAASLVRGTGTGSPRGGSPSDPNNLIGDFTKIT